MSEKSPETKKSQKQFWYGIAFLGAVALGMDVWIQS